MSIPKRPKFYKVRLFMPYIGISVVIFFMNLMDSWSGKIIVVVVLICVSSILQRIFDPSEFNKYLKYEADVEKQRLKEIQKSNVNENIQKYVQDQRTKKLSAKWWQFWI
jgi:hypothetical protein